MACLLASKERCESRQPSLRRPREGTRKRRPRAAAKGNRRRGTGEGALPMSEAGSNWIPGGKLTGDVVGVLLSGGGGGGELLEIHGVGTRFLLEAEAW